MAGHLIACICGKTFYYHPPDRTTCSHCGREVRITVENLAKQTVKTQKRAQRMFNTLPKHTYGK